MRRSGSFALSPKKSHNFVVPGSVVTPVSRRQSFNTPSNSLVLLDGSNNDEAERKERQLNRLQQLQTRGVPSPTGTLADRRRSTSTFAGLTNQQITDHYSKCIQLSAENKINIKNAFNLQLIDYMTELLKQKDSDMNNFQVASCTLDASTKIYGYRVDSIHTDTLKMAGGLGRSKDRPDPDRQDAGLGEQDPTGKKRSRTKKCVTVETNVKNLNIAHFDLEFDVDPLFKKTASQFDDGTAGGGQFMNMLQLLDDSCQLVLDSDTVLFDILKDSSLTQGQTATIPTLPDVPSKLICPTFASFEFSTWKMSDEAPGCSSPSSADPLRGEGDHAFDINALPQPLLDDGDADGEDFFDQGDDLNDLDDCSQGGGDDTVVTLGGGACRQGAPRPPPPQLEILHLKDHLANTPLEYSYFDTRVMSAWAGPGHWKLKPLVKRPLRDSDHAKSKEKKKELILDYGGSDTETESQFAVTRRATKLSQNTVKKWSTHNTTLPADLHYDPAKLSKLYQRPGLVIRRQMTDLSEGGGAADDEGEVKTECPDGDGDGDGDSNYGDHSAPGYDDTDLFSQTVFPSQPPGGDDKTKDFCGDNLVEAPNKVSLINIGYARTAKKIDMKKLKTSLWSLLSDPKQQHPADDKTSLITKMADTYSVEFSRIYEDLQPRLPRKMAENLSVPLAFIALLHLANEHNLKLTSTDVLGDFVVAQS